MKSVPIQSFSDANGLSPSEEWLFCRALQVYRTAPPSKELRAYFHCAMDSAEKVRQALIKQFEMDTIEEVAQAEVQAEEAKRKGKLDRKISKLQEKVDRIENGIRVRHSGEKYPFQFCTPEETNIICDLKRKIQALRMAL